MEISLAVLRQELEHLQRQDYHTLADLRGYRQHSPKLAPGKNEDHQSEDILS